MQISLDKSLEILKIGIHPSLQTRGIGSRLVNDLKSRLSEDKFRIECYVPESNIVACKFFVKNGFRAISSIEEEETQYRFVYIKDINFYVKEKD